MTKGKRTETGAVSARVEAIKLGIQRKYPDALIMVRVGDFYMATDDDAAQLGALLHLALYRGHLHLPAIVAPGYAQDAADKGVRVILADGAASGEGGARR